MSEGMRTGAWDALGSDVELLLLAAHELKSPLALIRQLSMMMTLDGVSLAERERLTEQIQLTAERALRLTGDMTRSARSEALFDMEPLNPLSLCEEAAHELTPLFAARGRAIQVTARQRSPLLVGNRDLMRRILLNFGDNALYYADGEKPVEFNVTQIGGQVRLGVRDRGPAVPADVWRVLKQRLQACSAQVITDRPQSSGLGLYIAGQFAAMMDGRIGAVRHQDGATFYVDMTASHQMSLL